MRVSPVRLWPGPPPSSAIRPSNDIRCSTGSATRRPGSHSRRSRRSRSSWASTTSSSSRSCRTSCRASSSRRRAWSGSRSRCSAAWRSCSRSPGSCASPTDLFAICGEGFSGRDLILFAGGLFLIGKSTYEIHDKMEGGSHRGEVGPGASFTSVIIQILLLDLVFSLDSVITAVGMADHVPVMVAAIVIAVGVMMLSAGAISRLHRAPSDDQDARALVPAADRRDARRGGVRSARSEGIRLLRDGVLAVRGDAEPARGPPEHTDRRSRPPLRTASDRQRAVAARSAPRYLLPSGALR